MTAIQPRLAATVVLTRDSPSGPEFFMLRRGAEHRFMANAHVFAGGSVDDSDRDIELQQRLFAADRQRAARQIAERPEAEAIAIFLAAIRETFEESGVLLARSVVASEPAEAQLRALRGELCQGRLRMSTLLKRHRLQPDLARLHLFARWITPEASSRRFDAYFFAAKLLPTDKASADGVESTSGQWYEARDLLAQNAAGKVCLPPPTLCTIEEFAGAPDARSVLSRSTGGQVQATRPVLLADETVPTLVLPGDHRHPETGNEAVATGRQHYMARHNGHWRRYRSPETVSNS